MCVKPVSFYLLFVEPLIPVEKLRFTHIYVLLSLHRHESTLYILITQYSCTTAVTLLGLLSLELCCQCCSKMQVKAENSTFSLEQHFPPSCFHQKGIRYLTFPALQSFVSATGEMKQKKASGQWMWAYLSSRWGGLELKSWGHRGRCAISHTCTATFRLLTLSFKVKQMSAATLCPVLRRQHRSTRGFLPDVWDERGRVNE